MSLEIGRFTPTLAPPPAPTRPARAVDASAQPEPIRRFDTVLGDVPPAPTGDVRAQVDRAAQIAQELADRNRELHFTKDETTGRLIIQVRDLNGNVIRTIPPSHALDVLSGQTTL
jgi:flagellar protein FlaG